MRWQNNWADYGGSDMYVVNLGGQYHDDVRSTLSHLTSREYADLSCHLVLPRPGDQAGLQELRRGLCHPLQGLSHHLRLGARYVPLFLFSRTTVAKLTLYDLGNEPRCGADSIRNLPESPDGCSPELLTEWITEMSAFVKELDPNHMVTWGGEGAFNRESDDWAYNGSDGGDFDHEITIDTIDFGVFHSYPDVSPFSFTPNTPEQIADEYCSGGQRLSPGPTSGFATTPSPPAPPASPSSTRSTAGSPTRPASSTSAPSPTSPVSRPLVAGRPSPSRRR